MHRLYSILLCLVALISESSGAKSPVPPVRGKTSSWLKVYDHRKGMMGNRRSVLNFLELISRDKLVVAGGPTVFKEYDNWTVIDDLYFHGNAYIVLEDSNVTSKYCDHHPARGFGLSAPMHCLPVHSANGFLQNTFVKWIDGVSLIIDFPNIKYVDNMGYWFEIMAGIRAHLVEAVENAWKDGDKVWPFKHVILRNVVKPESKKIPWMVELLSISIDPLKKYHLGAKPKLWFFHDLARDSELWVGIERAIKLRKIKDSARSDPTYNVFGSPEKAQAFREAVWKANNVTLSTPKDITLLLTIDDAGFMNSREILALLHEYKTKIFTEPLRVRPYSPTLGTPLSSLVKRLSQAKVFIARHGSLLGCSMFLQPGSFVIEIMQYRYDGMDTFYVYSELSRSMGDIHHVTLSANTSESVAFQSDDDFKYDRWLPGECYVTDCLDAHEVAGIDLDIESLTNTLESMSSLKFSLAPIPRSGPLGMELDVAPSRAPRIQSNAGLWYDDDE
jgi:hypothetical protein